MGGRVGGRVFSKDEEFDTLWFGSHCLKNALSSSKVKGWWDPRVKDILFVFAIKLMCW